MSKNRYDSGDIIGKLREAHLGINQDRKAVDVIKTLGITDVSDSCWRKEEGGMSLPQGNRLKEPEKENERLRGSGFGLDVGQADPEGGDKGRLQSLSQRLCLREGRV